MVCYYNGVKGISTHAPRVRRDKLFHDDYYPYSISTHAPRVRRDNGGVMMIDQKYEFLLTRLV